MKKNNQSLELVKEQVGEGAVEQAAASNGEVRQAEALMFLGGIGAIRSLADKLSSQTIRALEVFGESKGYETLGYANFVDFLNTSPYSPMTKSQYYDRLNALESEGDSTYDLLNNLGVPLSKRKLLTEGDVQLDGDTLVIGQQRVPVNDRQRVVEAVRLLVAASQHQAKKIEKGTEQLTKVRKERDDLKKRGGSGGSLDEFDSALLAALGALTNLNALAFNLTDPERLQKREYTFERLAEARLDLEEALGVSAPSAGGEFDLSEQDLSELDGDM